MTIKFMVGRWLNAPRWLIASMFTLATLPAMASVTTSTSTYPVPEQVVTECVSTASRTYGVPELVIRAILKVEGGQVGTMSRNDNGSFDLGPMQLNTINLKAISKEYPFLTWRHLTYNPCINIMVGSWFLKAKIKNRNGVIWEGVGDYHSVTPSKRNVYLQRFLRHYLSLKSKYGLHPSRLASPSTAAPVGTLAKVSTAPATKPPSPTAMGNFSVPTLLARPSAAEYDLINQRDDSSISMALALSAQLLNGK